MESILPIRNLTVTAFLFGTLLLVADQTYRLYKLEDTSYSSGSKRNYFLYDGFFFSIYYSFGTALYFFLGALLLLLPSPANIFWRLLSFIISFSFFCECEALLEFFVHSLQIGQHLSMTPWNMNMFFIFIALGVTRWAVAMLNLNLMMAIEKNIIEGIFGYRGKRNQSKKTLFFGCKAQHLADYIVVHYLLYQALYGRSIFSNQLEGDHYNDVELFYWHLSILLYTDKVAHVFFWFTSVWLYLKYARKEITFFSFYA